MRKTFLQYLSDREVINDEQIDQIRQCPPGVTEPIGAIAFSYGMISGVDIDEILDEQRRDHRPFGEIAVERGCLTRGQVDRLLSVQQLRGAIETAEALALVGICEVKEAATYLGGFLASFAGQVAAAPVSSRFHGE